MEEIKLTTKQKAFCDYYIENGGNGTEAAIKAGYSEKTAAEMSSENLRKPNIIFYLKERNKQVESSRILSMQEIQEFWSDTIVDELREFKDRLKASELLGRSKGGFIDKVSHTGNVNVSNRLQGLSAEELKALLEK